MKDNQSNNLIASMASALEALRCSEQLSQGEFSNLLGISPKTYRRLVGDGLLSYNTLDLICRELIQCFERHQIEPVERATEAIVWELVESIYKANIDDLQNHLPYNGRSYIQFTPKQKGVRS